MYLSNTKPMTKQEHLNYIKTHGAFTIDCGTAIFSIDEIEILEKYGNWFAALTNGTLIPFTDIQERFIKVSHGNEDPFSPEERAWFKYLGRKKVEAKFGDKLTVHYIQDDDPFYSRDMVKSLRKTMFAVTSGNHRSA